jgi:hypothetical protein
MPTLPERKAAAQALLAAIALEEQGYNSYTIRQKTAHILHEAFCRPLRNHPGQCNWDGEGGDWTATTHRNWLDRAQGIIQSINASPNPVTLSQMETLFQTILPQHGIPGNLP